MAGTSEHDMTEAVMRIAAKRNDKTATFKRLYSDVPNEIVLTKDDTIPSTTRNGEPMWRQIVRNIKSHDKVPGNAIYEGLLEHVPRVGYRITPSGLKHII